MLQIKTIKCVRAETKEDPSDFSSALHLPLFPFFSPSSSLSSSPKIPPMVSADLCHPFSSSPTSQSFPSVLKTKCIIQRSRVSLYLGKWTPCPNRKLPCCCRGEIFFKPSLTVIPGTHVISMSMLSSFFFSLS